MKRKPLIWIASSKKDLKKFPEDIQDTMGYALLDAQEGKRHEKTKSLQGFRSADIIEIIDEDPAGTYRTVYTVRFDEVIFVLHAFQKKSKEGIKTPLQEIELVKSRLKLAQETYQELFKKQVKL